MIYLAIYLAAVSLTGFCLMAADKRKAQLNQSRVREKTLFAVSWLGGSAGVYAGIFAFRHKTKHRAFTVGIPFIMAAQCAVLAFLYILYYSR